MKSSAIVLRQTSKSFASNLLTVFTFLLINAIIIIPVAQVLLKTFE